MEGVRNIVRRVMDEICREGIAEAEQAGSYQKALKINHSLYDFHFRRYHAAVQADDAKTMEAELDELDKIAHQAEDIEKLIRGE